MKRRLGACILAGAAWLAGCGGPPARPVVQVDLAPPPAAAPLERWFRIPARPVLGPPDARGDSVALLGGRRVVVRADGSVELERPETARPIAEAVLVPTTDGPVLVAVSGDDLVAFPDPLGAAEVLRTHSSRQRLVGAVPGAVFVDGGDLALIDARTGAARPTESFSALEPSGVAFVDGRRGVADFAGLGRFVSTDGGASWQPSDDRGPSGALRAVPGGVVASGGAEDDAVFFEPERDLPAMKAWLTWRTEDPLALAVERGVPGEDGTAYVADDGLLARVDLRTGAILEAMQLQPDASQCAVTRTHDGSLLATCTPPGRSHAPGVHGTVDTTRGAMRLVRIADVPVTGQVRTGRSGGVLVERSCDGRVGSCVLQPDATFATLHAPMASALLPRADGTALFAHVAEKTFLVVGSTSAAGQVEIARVRLGLARAHLDRYGSMGPVERAMRRPRDPYAVLVDQARGPSVAVVGEDGTELFELRGAELRPERELPCSYATSRGGAFLCAGSERIFVRAPDHPTMHAIAVRAEAGLVSPVGVRLEHHVHVGLNELAGAPSLDPPATVPPRSPPVGRLTCATVAGAKPLPDLGDELARGGATGWIVAPGGGAALKVEGSGPATTWRLRWRTATGHDGGEARMPAPSAAKPTLDQVDVHGGRLALEVRTAEGTYVVAASNGSATATRVDRVHRVRAGHDGTIAWDDGDALVLAAPGRPAIRAVEISSSNVSTPSREGVWVVLESGSFAWVPGGPAKLAPAHFGRRPSVRELTPRPPVAGGGPGGTLAPCADGASGRSFALPEHLGVQIVVDGQTFIGGGRVDALLDRPAPCLASLTAGVTRGNVRRSIDVDFLAGRASTTLVGGDRTEVACTWGPPER